MSKGWLLDRMLGLPPATTPEVTVHADLPVPMRDGVVLRADRYVPVGRERAPVVVVRSPYGRKGVWGRLYCLPLARRGYQVLMQSCRGIEDSDGEFVPFAERDDGHDTVAWLRQQPWYPGRAATFGPSYLGMAQWAVAEAAGDELVAMTPVLTSSALARSMFMGGAFAQQTWLSWSAVIATQQDVGPGLRGLIRARTAGARKVVHALRSVPLNRADQAAVGHTLRWWQQWLVHHDPDDEYWQRLDHSAVVPRVRAPVVMVTGWQDLFLPWQLADWAALPDAVDKRLVVGPWTHEHPALAKRYMQEAIAWLDMHVHTRDRWPEGGPVRYYVTGAEEWRDADSWPPPVSGRQEWYLHAGGGLEPVEPSGGVSRYRYDPADPTPALGGPTAGRTPRVAQNNVEARPDVLTFTSAALASPREVIGPIGATVYLRSSVDHTDLVVRLCDVDRKGRSVNVCDGIRRVTPAEHPADSAGVRRVDIELWPTAHRFASGHRVRVQIASAAFPRFAANPGTGQPPGGSTPVAAEQQVLHQPEHASHIIVPVSPP
jgi:hypothetical protein